MTATPPTPQEALEAVGLPVPSTELHASEGIRLSDLDEWSVQVGFDGDRAEIDAWLAQAFGESRGLTVGADGEPISQRLAPEDVTSGSRYILGSNPADPAATYTVLISPDGTHVTVAAARTAR